MQPCITKGRTLSAIQVLQHVELHSVPCMYVSVYAMYVGVFARVAICIYIYVYVAAEVMMMVITWGIR